MSTYIAGKRLRGVEKFPLVMMLEPLHACNLTCTGCGRIREYVDTIKEKLTVEQCLNALDECGAPIVSICGGEPMIYPDLGRLVREILSRKKHIYLCTNSRHHRGCSSTCIWTDSKKRTIFASSAKVFFVKRSMASKRQKRQASWFAQTRRFSKKQTCTKSKNYSSIFLR